MPEVQKPVLEHAASANEGEITVYPKHTDKSVIGVTFPPLPRSLYSCRRWPHMECDMDFVRDLLLKVEADCLLDGYHSRTFDVQDFPDKTEEEICYHIDLLIEAGLLKQASATYDSPSAAVSRLTWNGHEFLANVKDVKIWTKVKSRINGLSSITLSIVAGIAEAEVKKHLGLAP